MFQQTIRHRSHDSEVRSRSMCAHIIHAKRYTILRLLELYRSRLTSVISPSDSFVILWSRTRTATLTTSIGTTSNSMHHTPACGAEFPIHVRQAKVTQACEYVKCDVTVEQVDRMGILLYTPESRRHDACYE